MFDLTWPLREGLWFVRIKKIFLLDLLKSTNKTINLLFFCFLIIYEEKMTRKEQQSNVKIEDGREKRPESQVYENKHSGWYYESLFFKLYFPSLNKIWMHSFIFPDQLSFPEGESKFRINNLLPLFSFNQRSQASWFLWL